MGRQEDMIRVFREDIEELVRRGMNKQQVEQFIDQTEREVGANHGPNCHCKENVAILRKLAAERFSMLLQEDEIDKLFKEKIASNG